jgi:hypothetical protein
MDENTTKASGFDAWAVVELFGHQRIAGHVTEQQIGGANFLRVDVPESDRGPGFTRFYGAGAIYALTPTTEEVATMAARSLRAEPINIYIPELRQLTAGAAVGVADDEPDFEEADDDAAF